MGRRRVSIRKIMFGFPLLFGVMLALLIFPAPAYADDTTAYDGDIMVGVFFNDFIDYSNTIYASTDGNSFYAIDVPYQDLTPTEGDVFDKNGYVAVDNSSYTTIDTRTNGGGHTVYCHYCTGNPSIIYYNGFFWLLGDFNAHRDADGDGIAEIYFDVSYSSDLVHWTNPEGQYYTNTAGVKVDTIPDYTLSGGQCRYDFDTVAPEWFVDDDGSVYIVVCCGDYGRDKMQPYMIKLKTLSAQEGSLWWPGKNTNPNLYQYNQLTVEADGNAKRMTLDSGGTNLPGADNRIDGSFYKEGSTYYLTIKRNYAYNEIWKTSDINDTKSWQLVNPQVSWGYEGPSITKFNGTTYLFTDHLSGESANGVCVSRNTSGIEDNTAWTSLVNNKLPGWEGNLMCTMNASGKVIGTRHGTVITISKARQPQAWQIVMDRLKAAGYSSDDGSPIWSRLSGTSRYNTAALIADEGFADGSLTGKSVILARGDDFPDALAASSLAGALGCPVLTTPSSSLCADAAGEIGRLGASNVYILGGTGSISAATEASVRALGCTTQRIEGTSRVDTACKIAAEAARVIEARKATGESVAQSDTCVITKGWKYADALAMAPYAYTSGSPVFLANMDGSISDEVVQAIADGGYTKAIILGGTDGIADSSIADLKSRTGVADSIRLAGSNRYATAKLIARWACGKTADEGYSIQPADDAELSWNRMAIARGDDFPDALASVSMLGPTKSTMLLVPSSYDANIVNDTLSLLDTSLGIDHAYILGGQKSVPTQTQAIAVSKTLATP